MPFPLHSLSRALGGALLLAGGLLATAPARAAGEVKAVASFSILGDLVREVGGARVQLQVLVGPGADGHVFQPSPRHARELAQADLLLSNGLGFEPWMQRLVQASGFQGRHAVASAGVEPLETTPSHHHGHDHGHAHGHDHGHGHGDVDPHAWQRVANVKIYVRNIAEALCSADAAGCTQYRSNAQAYQQKLDQLDTAIRAAWASLPAQQRKVITSHDAFGYYAKEYQVSFRAAQGVSTGAEATPRDIARLVRQIQAENIQALFVESISDPRLIDQIGRETGVRPAGALFSDALSPAGGPAASYLAMMRHNTDALVRAAGQAPKPPAP